jgi:hypothetical protein
MPKPSHPLSFRSQVFAHEAEQNGTHLSHGLLGSVPASEIHAIARLAVALEAARTLHLAHRNDTNSNFNF